MLPAGTLLTVVSGEGGGPVPGARVTVPGRASSGSAGQASDTDALGQVALASDLPLSPTPEITVEAQGFLTRSTRIRASGDTRFTLWPASSQTGLDAAFTSTLVYSPSSCPAVNTGQAALIRMGDATRTATVVLDQTLQDAEAREAHIEAVAILNATLGGGVTYVFATAPPASGVVFTSELNPQHPTCSAGSEPHRAAASVSLANNEITGGRIAFCSVDAARNVRLVLHELGHTWGLRHSSSEADAMFCTSGRPSRFAAREALAMALMRQRRPGNTWPDSDSALGLALEAGATLEFACGG